MSSVEDILQLLPQTQCEECGYKGCRPYAEAMLEGEAVDLCAPGGEVVLDRLEKAIGRTGDREKVFERYKPPRLAYIDQDVCIGCTKCIAPCPTQAIVGTKKKNHYVLASDCTGCGLCVPYCPVDCIVMTEDSLSEEGKLSLSDAFRSMYDKKQAGHSERTLEKKDQGQLQAELAMLLGKSNESD